MFVVSNHCLDRYLERILKTTKKEINYDENAVDIVMTILDMVDNADYFYASVDKVIYYVYRDICIVNKSGIITTLYKIESGYDKQSLEHINYINENIHNMKLMEKKRMKFRVNYKFKPVNYYTNHLEKAKNKFLCNLR